MDSDSGDTSGQKKISVSRLAVIHERGHADGFGYQGVVGPKYIHTKKEGKLEKNIFFQKNYHSILLRDSISRPTAPVNTMSGGDDTIRPSRQGGILQSIF
jgi:hypothetical protein